MDDDCFSDSYHIDLVCEKGLTICGSIEAYISPYVVLRRRIFSRLPYLSC